MALIDRVFQRKRAGESEKAKAPARYVMILRRQEAPRQSDEAELIKLQESIGRTDEQLRQDAADAKAAAEAKERQQRMDAAGKKLAKVRQEHHDFEAWAREQEKYIAKRRRELTGSLKSAKKEAQSTQTAWKEADDADKRIKAIAGEAVELHPYDDYIIESPGQSVSDGCNPKSGKRTVLPPEHFRIIADARHRLVRRAREQAMEKWRRQREENPSVRPDKPTWSDLRKRGVSVLDDPTAAERLTVPE